MYALSELKILNYLKGQNDDELFTLADQVREKVFKNEVYLRAIVEFSNVCNKKCFYCGLRAPNSKINRYRLDLPTIMEASETAALNGARTIVLQSGDDFCYSKDQIGELVKDIKNRHDVAVTLSIGDRDLDEYGYWFECGADRCLIKIETSNPKLYKKIRSGEEFNERLNRIKSLHGMGYEIGSGIIVGLPDSNVESLLKDILFLTDLKLDMIAAGPFVPHPDTPFADAAPGDLLLSYRVTALLRILNPESNIPATSALDSFDAKGREIGLSRGCNVIMPSVTPSAHRADYNIYPGKNSVAIDVSDSLSQAESTIRYLNLIPSSSKGFSKRNKNVQ
ncbi:[FeFe] hydrogenase H-cluster radical SAM maturase HydE [Maridesulfovibrio ferrireducens]|uniref:[FeFe] hydrogenase H-cluster radical SAM maturase HydE n=1 Tax=Maridesulfovibrio ferrireducens TaxID=246191 RepID=UPI001A1D5DB2|nr:[FeFe] hydrogenase H-cluster radical SAM maturase HydE [Maridesulfovibrio ferrireducens]MBI9112778.1 [FeFe] hydrogenase H-cluster radical SAM maturase HydE [Maridesulfovibrio ferrireducens]